MKDEAEPNRGNHPSRRTHRFLVTLIWAVIIGAFWLKATQTMREVAFLKAHGVLTTATITQAWPCGSPTYVSRTSGAVLPGQGCGMLTMKTSDGHPYSYFFETRGDLWVGQSVDVVYNPQSPSTFMPEEALLSPANYYPVLALLKSFGIIFLVVGITVLTIYLAALFDPNERKRKRPHSSDRAHR